MNKVKICAPSRIHISLACMGPNSYRRNGGAGFAISGFDTIIVATASKTLSIDNSSALSENRQFSKDKLKAVSKVLKTACRTESLNFVNIEIISAPPQHCGFGSGTALELACLESVFWLSQKEYTPAQLLQYSSRGGTSGAGINTYFQGGFILDLGHAPSSAPFLPSSAVPTSEISRPSMLGRWPFPDWPIRLYLPQNKPGMSGALERAFFSSNCTANFNQITETAFLLTFGLVPALIEENLEIFCSAINDIQITHWKEAEWREHGSSLYGLRDLIRVNGALCVGMSSFGPLLYSLGDGAVSAKLPHIIQSTVCANNTGRKITLC